MTSGGRRARSGPAPDPNALRRERGDDPEWIELPTRAIPKRSRPKFPLERMPVVDVYFDDGKRVREVLEEATVARFETECALWDELWMKPQAHMWKLLGLEYEVAAYVRAFIRSVSAEGTASDRTAALRMSAEIGLSLPGMHQQRWKLGTDEVAERRASKPAPARQSARDRMRALNE